MLKHPSVHSFGSFPLKGRAASLLASMSGIMQRHIGHLISFPLAYSDHTCNLCLANSRWNFIVRDLKKKRKGKK